MEEKKSLIEALKTLFNSIGNIYKIELSFTFIQSAKYTKTMELKEAFNVLGAVDKGYKEYFRTIYSFYIEKNEKVTEECVRSIIEHAYPAIEIYMDIWIIIKTIGNNKLFEQFIDLMLKLLTTHKYPVDLYIKGSILLSKALIHNRDLISYKKAYVVLQRLIQFFPPFPLPIKSKYTAMVCPINFEFENLPLPGEYLTLSRNILKKFSITRFDSKEDTKEVFATPEETLSSAKKELQKRKNSFYTPERGYKAISTKVFLCYSFSYFEADQYVKVKVKFN